MTRPLVILTASVIAMQCLQSIVNACAFLIIVRESVSPYTAIGLMCAVAVANVFFVVSVLAGCCTAKLIKTKKKNTEIVPVADVAVLSEHHSTPPIPPSERHDGFPGGMHGFDQNPTENV